MPEHIFLQVLIVLFSCVIVAMPSVQRREHIVSFFQNSCKTSEPNPCQQTCMDIQSGGFYCQCRAGFVLNKDGMTCSELSEAPKKFGNKVVSSVKNNNPGNQTTSSDNGFISRNRSQQRGLLSFDHTGKNNNHDKNNVTTDNTDVIHIQSVSLKSDFPSLQKESYSRQETLSGVVLNRELYNIPEGGMYNRYSQVSVHEQDVFEDGKHPWDVDNSLNWGLSSSSQRDALPPVDKEVVGCGQVRCENNATCAVIDSRAVCQCPFGTSGKQCEKTTQVKYPKFEGTGYLTLGSGFSTQDRFSFSLEFRPDSPNGLLVFSAGLSSNGLVKFFTVVLEDGFVIHRSGCGQRTLELKSDQRVNLGAWNIVVVTRDSIVGALKLNTGQEKVGHHEGNFCGMVAPASLHLGGHQNMSAIFSHTLTTHLFVGCLQELQLNSQTFHFQKELVGEQDASGFNVGECSEHVCDHVTCQNGGTCVSKSADGFQCLCPLSFHGDVCQNDTPVHIPYFSGHSYLKFPGLGRSVLSYTKIEVVFKPADHEGTILYNGFSENGGEDFISLTLRGGYLEFRFDLGTGPAVIRSLQPVSMGSWHLAQVSRTGLLGSLRLDGQLQGSGQAAGAFTQLTLWDGLYLGGHPDMERTSAGAYLNTSFTGCLQKVTVNKQAFNLVSGALSGINISPCSHPCTGGPCLNGGHCRPHLESYMCSCPIGFSNTNCEHVQQFLPNKPMFTGESFLLYKDQEIIKRVAGSRMDLQIYIRPSGRDGLLFWSGEDQTGKAARDYISLGFQAGSLVLRYNLGSGEAVINYNRSRLFDGRWHLIRVQRNKQDTYMEIDKREIVEGSSPGDYTFLNTNKQLYLGGMPNVAEKTRGKFTSGYVGCARALRLATDYDVKLLSQAHTGRNVDQCRKKKFSL